MVYTQRETNTDNEKPMQWGENLCKKTQKKGTGKISCNEINRDKENGQFLSFWFNITIHLKAVFSDVVLDFIIYSKVFLLFCHPLYMYYLWCGVATTLTWISETQFDWLTGHKNVTHLSAAHEVIYCTKGHSSNPIFSEIFHQKPKMSTCHGAMVVPQERSGRIHLFGSMNVYR